MKLIQDEQFSFDIPEEYLDIRYTIYYTQYGLSCIVHCVVYVSIWSCDYFPQLELPREQP